MSIFASFYFYGKIKNLKISDATHINVKYELVASNEYEDSVDRAKFATSAWVPFPNR